MLQHVGMMQSHNSLVYLFQPAQLGWPLMFNSQSSIINVCPFSPPIQAQIQRQTNGSQFKFNYDDFFFLINIKDVSFPQRRLLLKSAFLPGVYFCQSQQNEGFHHHHNNQYAFAFVASCSPFQATSRCRYTDRYIFADSMEIPSEIIYHKFID